MDEIRELAERIQALRDACGYTEEEVAEAIGIDVEAYKGYETNAANVPISVIYSLAKLYNVDFSEIMTGTSAKLRTYQVVRKGEGQNADRYPGGMDMAFKIQNL